MIDKIKLASIISFLLLNIIFISSLQSEEIFSNPIKYNSLSELIIAVVDGIVIILIPIMVFSIVWIGFNMIITISTNPSKYTGWKEALIIAFIGLFIVLSAKGIIEVIQNTAESVLSSV